MRTKSPSKQSVLVLVSRAYVAMQAQPKKYGPAFVQVADIYYTLEAQALNMGVSQERIDESNVRAMWDA